MIDDRAGDEPTAPPCPLCGDAMRPAAHRVPGYVEGRAYRVRPCPCCGSSSVEDAGAELPALYDAIYRHRTLLPGYERYERHAAACAAAADPLAWLAATECAYAFVAAELSSRAPAATRVLEVGSGLGYLTAALRQRGFEATGIDLSSEAVEAARARYGPWYEVATLSDRALESPGGFDVVVMTELIEHVLEPVALLREAGTLLAPGGALLVTTPNRDAYDQRSIWRTEQPPVHLHWISAAGLQRAAARAGLLAERLLAPPDPRDGVMDEAAARGPLLTAALRPWRPTAMQEALARLRRAPGALRRRLPPAHASPPRRLAQGATLCAVLGPATPGRRAGHPA